MSGDFNEFILKKILFKGLNGCLMGPPRWRRGINIGEDEVEIRTRAKVSKESTTLAGPVSPSPKSKMDLSTAVKNSLPSIEEESMDLVNAGYCSGDSTRISYASDDMEGIDRERVGEPKPLSQEAQEVEMEQEQISKEAQDELRRQSRAEIIALTGLATLSRMLAEKGVNSNQMNSAKYQEYVAQAWDRMGASGPDDGEESDEQSEDDSKSESNSDASSSMPSPKDECCSPGCMRCAAIKGTVV